MTNASVWVSDTLGNVLTVLNRLKIYPTRGMIGQTIWKFIYSMISIFNIWIIQKKNIKICDLLTVEYRCSVNIVHLLCIVFFCVLFLHLNFFLCSSISFCNSVFTQSTVYFDYRQCFWTGSLIEKCYLNGNLNTLWIQNSSFEKQIEELILRDL